jgi:hypothetical protein
MKRVLIVRPTARAILAAVAAVPLLVLLLPAFAVGGVMFLFAACVRLIGRLLEPRFVPWQELIAFDQALGWKPRPDLDIHYLAHRDDVFRMVTDQEGWPGTRPLEESEVVVIGDSFAFGYGVDTGKTFADVSGLPVKAVGAPGYSMVHGVLLMEQFGKRLAGKLVVWFVYTENDLQDNLAPEMRQYRAPFVRPAHAHGGWEIVGTHIGPVGWRCSNLDRQRLFAHFCVSGPLANRAYSAAEYLIGRAAASCRLAGAHLVVVTIPHPMQLTAGGLETLRAQSGRQELCDPALPDRRIAESCQQHGVPMIAGKDHLSARDYKRREGIHWNERGHRRMAKLVVRLYESFASGALDELTSRPHVRIEGRLAPLHESPASPR